MSTVRQYFDSDFTGFIGPEGPLPLGPNAQSFDPPVMWKVLHNFDSRATCVVFYVPDLIATAEVCAAIINNFDWVDEIRKGLKMITGFPNEPVEDLSECIFTGRVAMYVEGQIAQQAVAQLTALAATKNLSLLLRDAEYARIRDAREQPHAFISHDARDKDAMARPLAVILTQNLCKVWYDEFSLRIGDSLRAKIEEGLKSCKKCILILTPNFLSNERWAKREFDSVFTREIVQNENLFLPVWSRVTRDVVFKYSPILADRVGILWERGVEVVARELLKVLL